MAVILAHPPISFLSEENENIHKAKSVLYHVLRIFILDCKEIVSKGVQMDIDRQLDAAPPLNSHGRIRKEALMAWKKEDDALSWGIGRRTVPVTYRHLVTLLSDNPEHLGAGLVKSGEKWNYQRLAKHMVEWCGKDSKSAPLSKIGYFPTALFLATTEIKKYSPTPASADVFATSLLAYMMERMRIHFVPWHKPAQNENGGPAPRVVQHNHWLFLDHSSSQSPHAGSKTADNPSPNTTFARIANRDVGADPYAPWTIPDSIQDMGPLWEKATLPTDWDIRHATLATLRCEKSIYICNMYEYVQNSYDGKKWKHHLALVLAILMVPILPAVCFPFLMVVVCVILIMHVIQGVLS